MATYDSALGMWKSKNGSYYSTQSEAQNAERNYIDDDEFFMPTGGITARAPDAPAPAADPNDLPNPNNPGGISNNELRSRTQELQRSATNTANINVRSDRTSGQGGATPGSVYGAGMGYSQLPAASQAAYSYMHELGDNPVLTSGRQVVNQLGERAGVSHAGDVTDPAGAKIVTSPEQMFLDNYQRQTDVRRGLGTTLGGGNGLPVTRQVANSGPGAGGAAPSTAEGMGGASTPPSFERGEGRTGIDKETADAKNAAGETIRNNRDENAQLFADAFARYDNLDPTDYALGDEARGYQREGLAQQRMLLREMLNFDPDQYARRYQDTALARTIAAGRSAGGGASGQQFGMLAAMEQAPGLYAEGARQAAQLQNQRLGMAESAAKAFGDLGTMTRGQDEARAQFESDLAKGIADSVANLTNNNVQMNDRDSQMMAEIWMDFAKLQSVYEGMTSDEMLAWWQQETARRGQDKNFEAIMENLKAQGQISSKDLIGGLFQLGGGLVTTGGNIGAAYMQGQTARDVAAINAGVA